MRRMGSSEQLLWPAKGGAHTIYPGWGSEGPFAKQTNVGKRIRPALILIP